MLRSMGLGERFLYKGLKLNPIRMRFVGQTEMIEFLEGIGGQVLDVSIYEHNQGLVKSATYYLTKR